MIAAEKVPELQTVASLTPRRREAWRMGFASLKERATIAFESGLLPREIDSIQKAIMIAMWGQELRIGPMAALLGIYVVNGMPAMRGILMLRLIYERVRGARVDVISYDETACVVEMQRPGGPAQRFSVTIEDAGRAALLGKDVWKKHPATMLRWFAIRTGARVVFADALSGCPYMEDELEEGGTELPTGDEAIPSQAPAAAIAAPAVMKPAPVAAKPASRPSPSKYKPTWGPYKDKELGQIPPRDLEAYMTRIKTKFRTQKREIGGAMKEFLERGEAHLREKASPRGPERRT